MRRRPSYALPPLPGPQWAGQRAVTLNELMIAIALTSFLGMGLATYISNQSQAVNDLKFSLKMQTIAKKIEAAASRPEVIRASADYYQYLSPPLSEGNKKLFDCISPVASSSGLTGQRPRKSPCTVTDPEQQEAIDLILPLSGSVDRSKVAKLTLAGGALPIRYDLDGKKDCGSRSDPANGSCQFEARAYFWATCPPVTQSSNSTVQNADSSTELKTVHDYLNQGHRPPYNPSTCHTAQTIHIRYQIVHRPVRSNASTSRLQNSPHQLPAIPDELIFQQQKGFGALSTPVAMIPNPKSMQALCPPNYTITSIADGKPTCECLFPYREDGVGMAKVCMAVARRCAANERFRGLYKHDPQAGNRTICGKQFTAQRDGSPICCPVHCENVPLNQQCRLGGWIERIRGLPNSMGHSCAVEVCEVGKDGGSCGGGDGVPVQCTGEVRCCYETSP